MSDKAAEGEAWPVRAIGLALLGAVLGTAYHALLDIPGPRWTEDPLRLSGAAFVAVFGIAFAFTLERIRPLWSALFALAAATVVSSVFFWNGSPNGWAAGDEWRMISAVLVVAVAAPLFLAARDRGRFSLEAEPVHAHAWTSLVLWGAAWAFVLASFLTLLLLSELFSLIGLTWLRELMRQDGFTYVLIGAALGGGIGLLRDRDKLLGLLQRVATAVLSVLAPVLAAGLVLFVAALPFTGLQPLWDKTSSTTPILLLAIAAAFFLANAVIGNSAEEEAKSRALRVAAIALAAVLAPLGMVAAISTWLRIDQHGFTPERLWGLVFVLTVLVVALAYLWALIRGRKAWAEKVRAANVRLALFICATSLVLAMPLIDFGAVSTRDQLARMQNGRVSPDKFDWAALRFDFGPEGRRAVEHLARTAPDARARLLARKALEAKERYALDIWRDQLAERADRPTTIIVRPNAVPVPRALREAVLPSHPGTETLAGAPCQSRAECLLFWEPGDTVAIAVSDGCAARIVGRQNQARPGYDCEIKPSVLELRDGRWRLTDAPVVPATAVRTAGPGESASLRAERQAIDSGDVAVREVTRRQLFIGGKPVGGVFE